MSPLDAAGDSSQRSFVSNGHGLDASEIARRLNLSARRSYRVADFLKDAVAAAREEHIYISPSLSGIELDRRRDDYTPTKAATDEVNVSRKSLLVLTCILRASEALQHAASQPLFLTNETPGFTFEGTGVGSLVAAAYAASSNLDQLHLFLVYAVRIAARTAAALEKRSRQTDPLPGPWSIEVRGATYEMIVDEIALVNQRNRLQPLHQIYVAAELAEDCIIVAGGPTILRNLAAEWTSKPWKLQPFPGEDLALHASHLPKIPYSHILRDVSSFDIPIPGQRRYRTATCGILDQGQPRTFAQLLGHAIHHLAQEPVRHGGKVRELSTSARGNVHSTPTPPLPLPDWVSEPHEHEKCWVDPEEIAIIGMSGRFPGSEDISSFWNDLMEGRSLCKKIPSERFPIENGSCVPWGCFLDDVTGFDPSFFSISSREAARIDPAHRLAMMVAYEALEMAGIPVDLSRKQDTLDVATFVGQTVNDYVENLEHAGLDAYYTTSANRAFSSGRINYHLGLTGQAITLDTACSSSATAVTSACTSLRNGECEVALAGGVNIITSPHPYIGLSKGGFLSPTGPCKSFRPDADGYCRGEAVGFLVLKRVRDAIRDNDNILATVCGYARAHSVGASSIVHPHAPTQRETYAKACRNAGIDPSDISYVECHGTGTVAGDSAEAESLRCFFGPSLKSELIIGAVKAATGHGEAAAGVSSLIKSIMVLQSKMIPPQPPASSPDRSLWIACLAKYNIRPCDSPTALPSSAADRRRVVMVNTFDASGGSTSVVLSEAPRSSQAPVACVSSLPWHVVTCSARTPAALRSNIRKLLSYLKENGGSTQLQDVAYTLNARRTQHLVRQVWVVQSVPHLCELLSNACDGVLVADKTRPKLRSEGDLVFVFAGQGSSLRDIGKELFQTSRIFRHAIEDHGRLCSLFEFPDFLPTLLGETSEHSPSGAAGQLAVLAFELALVELWRSWGVEPGLVVGHSLGEYAALCVAGVLSVADAIYLVGKRAMLMEDLLDAGTHGMLAVRSPDGFPEGLPHGIANTCEVACVNGPRSRIVGGSLEDLEQLRLRLAQTMPMATSTLLSVNYAFHTSQMDPIVEHLRGICKDVTMRKPRIPIVSVLEGRTIRTNEVLGPDYLVRHMRQPVQFYSAILASSKTLGSARYMEIGPDATCSGMMRDGLQNPTSVTFPSCRRNVSPWKTLLEAVAWLHTSGERIAWSAMYEEHRDSLKVLPLPTYSFELKSYWLPWGRIVPQVLPSKNYEPESSFISSTLQRMVSSSSNQQIFTTCTTYAALQETISGHSVAGISVCPMSTIGDLAVTAATYRFPFGHCNAQSFVTKAMEVEVPITSSDPGRANEVKVIVNHGTARHEDTTVEISMQTSPGQTQKVATCKLQLLDETQHEAHLSPFLSSRVEAVMKLASESGQILRGQSIYRLFNRLVKYSSRFQGLGTVYITPECTDGILEAVGIVRVSPPRAGERFTSNPYWTDALTHLPGLVLNSDFGHEALQDDVFLATGFEEFQWHSWAGDDAVEYTSYTRLHPGTTVRGGNVVADVVVFHQDTLVLSCKSIIFSRMPKQTLLQILGGAVSSTGPSMAPRKLSIPQTNGFHHSKEESTHRRVTGTELSEMLISAAVEEAGLDHVPTDPLTSFLDIGLDSLGATAAVDRVSKKTGIQLSFTMLYHAKNFAALTEACQVLMEDPVPPPPAKSDSDRGELTNGSRPNAVDCSVSRPSEAAVAPTAVVQKRNVPKAKASLIHGRKSITLLPVFLMPSGSGRPSDWIHLPPLNGGRRVYALGSPFLGCEDSFTCSIVEASSAYVEAIREIQPSGPYLLGGYSVGFAYAVEVARSLAAAGEQIDALIAIDYPVETLYPADWTPTPRSLASIPFTRTPHDLATFKALHGYEIKALDPAAHPKTGLVIWATKSQLSSAAAEIVEEDIQRNGPEYHDLVWWFLCPRNDRGSGGWENILGPHVRVEYVDADHFQLLNSNYATELGRMINATLEGFD